MKIIQKFMTRNDCYTANKKITPKGIMVHSDGCKAGLKASAWYDRWNKSFKAKEIDREVCVHAFVDDTECYQYLPWNYKGWHGGGKSNDTHIGFEICEPKDYDDKTYFAAIWNNAIELCVMLCRQFNLTEKDIICHCEGYKLGIASNHGDVMHWFPKHGKNMDMFRAEVKARLSTPIKCETEDEEMTKNINISINGEKRMVESVQKRDAAGGVTNYIKLRDLESAKIAIGYDQAKDLPTVNTK